MNGIIKPAGPVSVDTQIFIDAIEGTSETAEPSRKLVRFLNENHGIAMTSEITLAETLAPPKREGVLPLHVKRRVYLDLLLWSRAVDLVPVTRDILIETADIRAVANLKLPDAIHLATAVRMDCTHFVCADGDFRNLPADMKQVRPTEREIDELLKDLA